MINNSDESNGQQINGYTKLADAREKRVKIMLPDDHDEKRPRSLTKQVLYDNVKLNRRRILKEALLGDGQTFSLFLSSARFNLIILVFAFVLTLCGLLKMFIFLASNNSNATIRMSIGSRALKDFVDYFSLTLTVACLLEMLIKLVLIPSIFKRVKLELLDLALISISLVLQLYFLVSVRIVLDLSNLLFAIRFWRIFLLIDNIFELFEKRFNDTIDELKEKHEKVVTENRRLEQDLQKIVVSNILSNDFKHLRTASINH